MKIAFKVHTSKVQKYNLSDFEKEKSFEKYPPHEKTGKIRRCARPGSEPAENTAYRLLSLLA
jgi:hypothetical protein